jgi:histone-lysine N-methyltransferase SETMAR
VDKGWDETVREGGEKGIMRIVRASSSLINFQRTKLPTYQRKILLNSGGAIERKTQREFRQWVLFLHSNARAHRALATHKKPDCLGFQCLDRQPHSPDLAPFDYHLFPGLKNNNKKSPLSSDTQVIAATEKSLDGQNSELFVFIFKNLRYGIRSALSFVGSVLTKSRVCSM